MKLPFNIDLQGKVAVVTGGGGILCGYFSEGLAACGAKVAVLDLRKEAAEKIAKKINDNGGIAMAVEAKRVRFNNSKNSSAGKGYPIHISGVGSCIS